MIQEFIQVPNTYGVKVTVYPEAHEVEGRPNESAILYNGRIIGRLKRHEFGLWPVQTGVGIRYYSNPLCAAYDFYLSKDITAKEAAHVFPPIENENDRKKRKIVKEAA